MQTLLSYYSQLLNEWSARQAWSKLGAVALYSFFTFFLFIQPSWAGLFDLDIAPDINGITKNIVNSVANLPSLISAVAFLGGLAYATTGVLRLRSHVENPQQNPLTSATGRLVIGGALVSLPVIYAALQQFIIGDDLGALSFEMDDALSATGILDSILGSASTLFGDLGLSNDLNAMLNAIISSISELPSFISIIGYLLGLYLGVLGLLKLREHIEDPDRNPLKEATIRLFVGACFLSLPAIYSAMVNLVTGGSGSGLLAFVDSFIDASGFTSTSYSDGDSEHSCTDDLASGLMESLTFGLLSGDDGPKGLGKAMCKLYGHVTLLPSFLMLMARLLGFYFGFMALLKLRDHVLNPQQTPLSQSITRFVAGGALISINVIKDIIKSTVTPASSTGSALLSDTINGYSVKADCGMFGGGLFGGFSIDGAISSVKGAVSDFLSGGGSSQEELEAGTMAHTVYCAVTDVMGPLHVLLNFFTFAAGIAFLMIGISRLLKSEQDGAKGPAGIGTIATFIVAGVLMSFSDFIRITTATLFSDTTTMTYVTLSQDVTGLNAQEAASVQGIITAVLKFMIMVGMISFVRGIFMIRGVAEGNNQVSMMAGVTHIIAGTLAINLGGFITLVQVTLGIDGFAGALSFEEDSGGGILGFLGGLF